MLTKWVPGGGREPPRGSWQHEDHVLLRAGADPAPSMLSPLVLTAPLSLPAALRAPGVAPRASGSTE